MTSEWYSAVLARLHINTFRYTALQLHWTVFPASFCLLRADQSSCNWQVGQILRGPLLPCRVDCVFPPEGGLEAMAASVIGGQEDSSFSGSALYIAASLFNHSCCPNVNATFNENNGTVLLCFPQSANTVLLPVQFLCC